MWTPSFRGHGLSPALHVPFQQEWATGELSSSNMAAPPLHFQKSASSAFLHTVIIIIIIIHFLTDWLTDKKRRDLTLSPHPLSLTLTSPPKEEDEELLRSRLRRVLVRCFIFSLLEVSRFHLAEWNLSIISLGGGLKGGFKKKMFVISV